MPPSRPRPPDRICGPWPAEDERPEDAESGASATGWLIGSASYASASPPTRSPFVGVLLAGATGVSSASGYFLVAIVLAHRRRAHGHPRRGRRQGGRDLLQRGRLLRLGGGPGGRHAHLRWRRLVLRRRATTHAGPDPVRDPRRSAPSSPTSGRRPSRSVTTPRAASWSGPSGSSSSASPSSCM